MRTKDEILNNISKFKGNYPVWGGIKDLDDQLTIEVLIDIRDQLRALTTIMGSVGKVTYMDE